MLKPPENLTAVYSAGSITIKWQIDPNSDTPTEVYVNLTNQIKGLQKISPGAPTSLVLSGTDVSQFAGTLVSIYVAFYSQTLGEPATAATSVVVPSSDGGVPPTPPSSPGHYQLPPPIKLSITPNAAAHSVLFQWVNQGPRSGNAYDKVIVRWAPLNTPVELVPEISMSGDVQQITLGPIYPGTNYLFTVEGGVTGGLFVGDNYSGWANFVWQSPAGSVPYVGWYRNWFQIHPEAPLQPFNPRLAPGKSVTALWRDGTSDLHLDLFLAGGIPTLGVPWTAWWQPGPSWQPWFTPGNSVWAPNVSVKAGAVVSAVWRPGSKHLDLFATANDGTVWSTWWEQDAGWQSWFAIHPEIKMTPGATVTAVWRPNDNNHLDLFVTSASGALGLVWSTWWEHDTGWQPWFTVSDAVWSANVSVKPGAQVTALWRAGDLHLDLFAAANDGTVWSTWWDTKSGWQQWFVIDPSTKVQPGAPIAAYWSSSEVLELFATLSDGTVVTTWWESAKAWHGWVTVDAAVKLQPGAAVTVIRGPNIGFELQILGTAADGVVWTAARNDINPSGVWTSWTAVHPETAMVPGATIAALWRPSDSTPTHLDLFARGSDGSVWSIWFEPTYYD